MNLYGIGIIIKLCHNKGQENTLKYIGETAMIFQSSKATFRISVDAKCFN
jgi:hypothetical protein